MPEAKMIKFDNCSRCGLAHELLVKPLAIPFAPPEAGGLKWDGFALCPTNGEPIMVIMSYAPGADPEAPAASAREHALYDFIQQLRTTWIPLAVTTAVDSALAEVARMGTFQPIPSARADALRAVAAFTNDPNNAELNNIVGWPRHGETPAQRALTDMTASRDFWRGVAERP